MINKLLPLTEIRLDIIVELYKKPLRLKDLAIKIGKSKTLVHNTLKFIDEALIKDQGVYFLKKEFIYLFEKVIIKYILEKQLGNYYDFLLYLKKHLEIEEMIFFGSFYKGNSDKNSDLDLYIISKDDDDTIKRIKDKFYTIFELELDLKVVHPNIQKTKENNFLNLYSTISTDKSQGIKIPLDILEG